MSEQLIATPSVFGENGNFLLERELGTGGMGGVYMGRDKMLDRPVAVKVMLKELGSDAEFVEKFKKEAQSAARLIHPNIAQVYSYGICDGMPYIAMELACGGSLYSLMNSNPGKTDVSRVVKLCQQVAQALQCASDQGCVHGDVKPENILLDANGNAKLVDFGLAAMQKDTDEIWGTPYYISPEKVKKEPIDFRADMYSLGGTLYHALTGVAPFEGEDAIAVVKRRFEAAPKKPSEIRPELTPAIDALVMKMLELEKENRFPSFEALLKAFQDVLTSGLTASKSATTTTGTKRVTVRGRRVVMRKRPGATTTVKVPVATTAESTEENAESDTTAPDDSVSEDAPDNANAETENDEEEEEGGSLVLKVVGVIVGVLVLIGAIIGGLVWYKISDKNARIAEAQAQIVSGIEKARAAITETVDSAKKFADEFDAFAARAVEACEKTTEELRKILPADQAAMLKPAISKELLDAINSTNETQAVAVEAPVAAPVVSNAVVAVASNAVASATNAVAKAAKAVAKTTNAVAKVSAAAPEKKDKAKPEKPAGKPVELSPTVVAMHELWDRAYSCQAGAIRIRFSIVKLVKKSEAAATITGKERADMEKLAELSRALVEMLDVAKTSKDVENVRKNISLIKSKGTKTIEQTTKRLRIEKLEADRKAKAEAAAQAEKERLEKKAAEKAKKIAEETAAAKEKFETIATQGSFRQLDWKSARRQLEQLKADCETPEGQLAVELELRKVAAMQKMHDVLIKNMGGGNGHSAYTFTKKSKLKGYKVTKVDEKEIQLSNGKKTSKLTWTKFLKDNYINFIEVVNQYVFNGRKNARLSQRDVAETLAGAALVLQLACADEVTAAQRATTLAQEAVKNFPEYQNIAKEIFPDIEFGASASQEE